MNNVLIFKLTHEKLTNERWLEECLGAAEPLVTDSDDLTVGQLVGLFQGWGGGGGGHLILEIKSHVAQLLLNVTNNLPLGCKSELEGYEVLFNY